MLLLAAPRCRIFDVDDAGDDAPRDTDAEGHITFGQKCRTMSREVCHATLALCQRYFVEGKTCDQVLELLMPA